MTDVVWSGDGRFDSMGHSAKYGVYTLLSSPLMKIVHFELVQVYKIFISRHILTLVATDLADGLVNEH